MFINSSSIQNFIQKPDTNVSHWKSQQFHESCRLLSSLQSKKYPISKKSNVYNTSITHRQDMNTADACVTVFHACFSAAVINHWRPA